MLVGGGVNLARRMRRSASGSRSKCTYMTCMVGFVPATLDGMHSTAAHHARQSSLVVTMRIQLLAKVPCSWLGSPDPDSRWKSPVKWQIPMYDIVGLPQAHLQAKHANPEAGTKCAGCVWVSYVRLSAAVATHHVKNTIASRLILLLVLGFWDNNTVVCAGAIPYRRYFPATTRI